MTIEEMEAVIRNGQERLKLAGVAKYQDGNVGMGQAA